MNKIKLLPLLIIVSLMCSCSTINVLYHDVINNNEEIGLYVISSYKLIPIEILTLNKIVESTAINTIEYLMKDSKSRFVSLNNTIEKDSVFQKGLGTFSIDEKEIAKNSLLKNYRYTLILYYSYANPSNQGDAGGAIANQLSLFSFLIDNKTTKIVNQNSSRHNEFGPFLRALEKLEFGVNLNQVDKYRLFVSMVTMETLNELNILKLLNDLISTLPSRELNESN